MEDALSKLLFLIAASSLALGGCHVSANVDSGPTVQRGYQVGGFDGIAVDGPYDVRVVSGGGTNVAASGPQKSLDKMTVEVSNGMLQIRPAKQEGINIDLSNSGHVKVTVTVPTLQNAALTGSGALTVEKLTTPSFKGEVGGSGDLRLDNVDVQTLELTTTGSGDIRAIGKARSAKLTVTGSGDIDGRKLAAENAQAQVSGSGSIRAQATGTAMIGVNGSGDVDISGGAKCTINKNGSGDARCS